jgi:hypothetical protein
MTEEIRSASEAGHQSQPAAEPETAAVISPAQEPEPPVPEPGSAGRKPVAVAIASLRHVMTEEEKKEEDRRWKAIKSNRHPDTGDRLRPGDEKTLRPLEKSWLKMQRSAQMTLRTIDDAHVKYLMTADILERACTMKSLGYTPYWCSRQNLLDLQVDRIARSDVDLLREQLERSQVGQTVMGAAWAAVSPRRDYDQLAEADFRRRFLEPLFDSEFVNRITSGGSAELMVRVAERHEPEGIRALSDQVHSAATGLITERWRDSGQLYRAASAIEFPPTLMHTEAQRLLSIYGPRIVDQTGFLVEQRRNLDLFAPSVAATSFERADLLARIALQSTFPSDFIGYDLANIEAVERYGHAALAQLEADFSRTKNPVFAWEALAVARRYGVEVPDWVWDVVESAAAGITELREEVENGTPLGKEAEVVGRALGFGKKGRGGTGWFAEATQLSRDREVYFAVTDWLEAERIRQPSRKLKLTSAYSEVAKQLNSNPSTVGQAYRRVKQFIGTPEEFDE